VCASAHRQGRRPQPSGHQWQHGHAHACHS
jgi:hypothetical protein